MCHQFFTTNVKIFSNHANQLQKIQNLSDSVLRSVNQSVRLRNRSIIRVDIMMKFAAILSVAFQGADGARHGLRDGMANQDIRWPKIFNDHA